MLTAPTNNIYVGDREGVNPGSSSDTCESQTVATRCHTNENEQQQPTQIRQELMECLLGVIENWIPFELNKCSRQAMLTEPVGKCRLSGIDGGLGLRSPNILQGVTWHKPSLHWTWKEEISTSCLVFFAPKATLDSIATSSGDEESPLGLFGTIESFQWTLELSSTKHRSNMVPPITHPELNRVEPMIISALSPNDREQILPAVGAIGPVQSSWKISTLKILHVELISVALAGTLSKEPCQLATSSTTVMWKSVTGLSLSCDKIRLVGSRPSTSAEFVQLAKVISILDLWTIPGAIHWRCAPVPNLKGLTCMSLADVYRQLVSSLDDMENAKQQNSPELKVTSAGGEHKISSLNNDTGARMKQSIVDSLVITGGLMATGASFVTPIGAAVSVAAVGVKDGIVAAAEKGKSSRNDENYKVGDITRGVVAKIKERREERRESTQVQSDKTLQSESYTSGDPADSISNSRRGLLPGRDKSRYVGVVGSSVGAAVGSLVAGPVGLLAGSLVGGAATRQAIRRSDRNLTTGEQRPIDPDFVGPENGDEEILRQLGERRHQTYVIEGQCNESKEQKKWKFGDNLRNVVRKGKVVDGRNADSSYKFGDFSRGLLSKK